MEDKSLVGLYTLWKPCEYIELVQLDWDIWQENQ
jgi:hypothetical protein